MEEAAKHFLAENHILTHVSEGITVAKVSLMYEGFRLARDLLYTVVDKKTVLYLSGGQTPKGLYTNLANDQKLTPGAVALIDERYGSKFHNNSNEKMIRETGLLPYLESHGTPFYPILQEGHPGLEQLADNYDMTVRYLVAGFPKSFGILGIGADGHTAGIAGNRPASLGYEGFTNPLFEQDKTSFVAAYADLHGPFKERVTMTFTGLSMLDFFLVLVFGEDKKDALKMMFTDGSEEVVPARFYKRPEIAKRTLLITDQKV
jgi:6-phosphogluconolactonase/glucosamine-6-phosphate isomerase/deaminase